jgi:hypothetical protein
MLGQRFSILPNMLLLAVLLQFGLQLAHPLVEHCHEHRKVCTSEHETHLHDESYVIHSCDFCAVLLKKQVFSLPVLQFFAPTANATSLTSTCQFSDQIHYRSVYHSDCQGRAPPSIS